MNGPAMIERLRVVIHIPGNSLERDAFQHKLGPNEAPSPTTKPSRRLELRKKNSRLHKRETKTHNGQHITPTTATVERTPGTRHQDTAPQGPQHNGTNTPGTGYPATRPHYAASVQGADRAMYARTTLGMYAYTNIDPRCATIAICY